MLTQVIINQTSSLQILNLGQNQFSSVDSEKLLTRMIECGVCSTLKVLNLYESIEFNKQSISKFADIIATAPVLKECNISPSMVRVQVEYASEEKMGAIVIKDWSDYHEIHRRETDKKETYDRIDIHDIVPS